MKKLKEIFECAPTINKVAFWACLLVSIGLMITGFIVPPTGEISGSVLTGVGELFAFASLGTGIAALEKGVDAKITKGDSSIELNNPDSDKK